MGIIIYIDKLTVLLYKTYRGNAMFNSVNMKICVYLIVTILVLGLLGVSLYQKNTIKTLNEELITLKADYKWKVAIYEDEINKSKFMIENLNNAVSEFMLSKDRYELEINEKEKEILINKIKKQEDIQKELDLDSSSDNQLKLITVILEEFGK